MIERIIREFGLEGHAADLFRMLALSQIVRKKDGESSRLMNASASYRDAINEVYDIAAELLHRAEAYDNSNNTRILAASIKFERMWNRMMG